MVTKERVAAPAAQPVKPAAAKPQSKPAPTPVVKDEDEDEDEEEAEGRAPRPSYMETAPASILDSEKRLTKVPSPENAGDAAYDRSKHLKPRRANFASEDVFMDFKAWTYDWQAERLSERAASLRKQAEAYRQFGDPAQRSKVARAQRLAEQFAKLKEQLSAEGIDVESLGL